MGAISGSRSRSPVLTTCSVNPEITLWTFTENFYFHNDPKSMWRIVTGNECYNRAVSAVFSQGIQSLQAKQQRVRCGECWRLAFFIHWRRPRPNHISTTQALSHYWHVSLCRSVWFTFNACCECIKCRALCRGWLAGHWSGWRTLEINQFQSMAGQWVHL